MRLLWVVLMIIALSPVALPAEHKSQLKLSDERLTPEQIEIYRVVLKNFTRDSYRVLNLANRTGPLGEFGPWNKKCFTGIEEGVRSASLPLIHRLDLELLGKAQVILVDPDEQQTLMDSEAEKALKALPLITRDKKVEEQPAQPLKDPYDLALFTFSEIGFAKEHRRAVVAFRWVCGRMCGYSSTLILKKNDKEWTTEKTCSEVFDP